MLWVPLLLLLSTRFPVLEFVLVRPSRNYTYKFTIDLSPDLWYPSSCYLEQFSPVGRPNSFILILLQPLGSLFLLPILCFQ